MWGWMGGSRPSRAERADAERRAERAAYVNACRAWARDLLARTNEPTADILAAYLRAVGA